ncbi:hypothetical protein GOBAR_AA14021 [Gossypium barbadense]|uniref:Uncharacterized protein n=1 Tax=Gossypium barbadense TaxID=3634 RepID=A0A2P5XTI1_GOSBA|nr:hypothetical protein GOBAR_AA14021 [Gossypium barbadense]
MAEKPDTFIVEGEVCPDAVFKWCNNGGTGGPSKKSEITLKAKKNFFPPWDGFSGTLRRMEDRSSEKILSSGHSKSKNSLVD